MKLHITPIAALVLAGGVYAAQTTPVQGIRDKTPEIHAFTNARIVTAPGQYIPNGTLVLRDGFIAAVGSEIRIPDDAIVTDLQGKTIYPAFIDPYTEYGLAHVGPLNRPNPGRRPKYEGDREGADSWNDAVHAEIDWVSRFKPDTVAARELHKLGFAVVQSARRDGIFRGRSFVALLDDGLPNDLVLEPRGMHLVSFNKGSSQQEYPSSLMGSIALIRQSLLDADWYVKARAAWEADPSQPMPEFNRAIRALADNGRRPMLFETDNKLSLLRAAAISHEFELPFVYVGANDEYQRLDEIRALDATLILPVDYPKAPTVKSMEDELDVTLAQLRHWNLAPSNPAMLAEAGVRFAFTTYRLKKKDDFLKNVRRAVKRGLPVETALAALTTVPAELCGVSELAGTLHAGKLGNFIVADDSLLQNDDAVIYQVWTAGHKHELEPLERDDFRGTYRMTVLNFNWDLILEGTIKKVSGRIAGAEDTATITVVEQRTDKLLFTARLEKLGLPGVTRFSARKAGDDLEGKCVPADGEPVTWYARLTAAFTPKAKDTGEENEKSANTAAVESDTVIARLTYPNTAFGYAELPRPQDVLIKNATVWTCEEIGILENTDILVRDGKFARIGQNLKAPDDILVIDATGKHVTPGLIDEHSHIAVSGGVNEGTHAVSAEVRIGDVVNSDDIAIYRALAGGATIAHLLHGSANPIGGQCQVIKLRWGASPEGLKFTAAPPTIKFALGENVKQSNWGDNYRTRYPQSRMGVETIMEDAFQAAREYEAAWAEYRSLRGSRRERTVPPRRDLQLETLLEILNHERFVHCHSYMQAEILMLMRLAERFGFRIQTFTHVLEGYKVAGEMAAHGAGASSFSDWWAYKFEVYDAIPYNTCLLSERGVVTSINSDSQELIRRLNQEAAKSVQYCGMAPEEAIKLATINPAMQLRVDDRVGSIAVGKDADFVIWNGPPLSVYSHPEQTWIDGTKYFDIETDARLRRENAAERRALIQAALAAGDSGGNGDERKWKPGLEKEWRCDEVIDVWQAVNR